jgi:hypothetical protein
MREDPGGRKVSGSSIVSTPNIVLVFPFRRPLSLHRVYEEDYGGDQSELHGHPEEPEHQPEERKEKRRK